jgi:hypothetical protein
MHDLHGSELSSPAALNLLRYTLAEIAGIAAN